jgi:hypothetical protein
VSAAPPGLGAAISTLAALSTAALQNSGTVAVVKTLTMTTMQKALIAATLVVAVGAGVYEARQVSRLQNQMQSQQREQRPLTEQLQQLRQERDAATNGWRLAKEEIEQLRRNAAQVPRLRGQVARLQAINANAATLSSDPLEQSAVAWKLRVAELKRRLEQMPAKKIPELQYLDEKDWLQGAKDADLESADGAREAFSELRELAKYIFAPQMAKALDKYVKANGGQLPASVADLKPYFETAVDDAVLQRYAMLYTGNVSGAPESGWLVAEKAPVDDDYDMRMRIGINGYGAENWDNVFRSAIRDFSKANNEVKPTESSQIVPYIKEPFDAERLQNFLKKQNGTTSNAAGQ